MSASSATLLYSRELSGAGMWSGVIKRGRTLRFTDLEGGANIGLLLYNAHLTVERYNMPDTLKGQHRFQLKQGHCLHSDMGRLLASITADTVGWHDSVCGCSDAVHVAAQYGEKTYQTAQNAYHRSARECFLIELAKWGLGKRDLVPNLNLFSKAVADDDGRLSFVPDHSPLGGLIDLRLEMDTLVVLNTCQHPLDPDPQYHPRRVKLEVFEAQPVAADDPCYHSRPENLRAAENNASYHALRF